MNDPLFGFGLLKIWNLDDEFLVNYTDLTDSRKVVNIFGIIKIL